MEGEGLVQLKQVNSGLRNLEEHVLLPPGAFETGREDSRILAGATIQKTMEQPEFPTLIAESTGRARARSRIPTHPESLTS